MRNGAHAVIYKTNPEADRAFLHNLLKLALPCRGLIEEAYQPRHTHPELMNP